MFNRKAKLQTNPHHKKADTRQLRNPFKKAIISLLGITLSVGLYSGMINVPREVQVPDSFAQIGRNYEVRDGDYFYTDQELSSIEYLNLNLEYITSWQSPDFLEWCTNVETMDLAIGTDSNGNNLDYVNQFPVMPSVTILQIDLADRTRGYSDEYRILAFDETNIGAVLDKFPNLRTLYVPGDRYCYFSENTLECYPNIKSLVFQGYGATNENCNIDFSKLTHLDSLSFYGADMYTLAINFTRSDYDTLKAAGVNMTFQFSNGNTVDDFLIVLDELDRMAEELNVSKDASDTAKINAILSYILINYSYDEEVSYCIANNIEHAELSASFYEGGRLSAVFNKAKKEDGTTPVICGNYSALGAALSKRKGLLPYYTLAKGHAYNFWNIDGVDVYYDATWLDGSYISVIDEEGFYHYYKAEEAIENGLGEELVWFGFDSMDDEFLEEYDSDRSHSVLNYPNVSEIGDGQYSNRLNEEPIINFNIMGKKVIAPLSVVVSIMAGIGAAVDVVKLQKIKSMAQKGRLTALKMKRQAESTLDIEVKNGIIEEINGLYGRNAHRDGKSLSAEEKIQNLSLDITEKFYYIDMNKETYDKLVGDGGYMREYCIYYLGKLFKLLGDDCDGYPNFLERSDYYLNDFLTPETTRFLRKYGFINLKNSKHLVRPAVSLKKKNGVSLN